MLTYLLIVAVVCGFACGIIVEPRLSFGRGLLLGVLLGPFGLVIAVVLRVAPPRAADRPTEVGR